ncbi:hypothetical protein B0H34DRAFT_761121 [Crassisporium funariophilum]|nr:hypothetical protein B0H34DRAFT_761121 [Crassisporium funariophilum]
MKTSSSDSGLNCEHTDGLLPAFTTRQYSHLPTPQSPNNVGRYMNVHPDSPVPHGTLPHMPSSSNSRGQRLVDQRIAAEDNTIRLQSHYQQCMTPESSPQLLRGSPTRSNNTATPRYLTPLQPQAFTTPKATSSFVKLESPIPISASIAPSSHISSPLSSTPEPLSHSLALSSPFMAKLSIGDRNMDMNSTSHNTSSTLVNDVFFSSISNTVSHSSAVTGSSISTPPMSPAQQLNLTAVPAVGGEMERIRRAMKEDRLAQILEAEKRRPEYLKRTKRTLSEADPGALDDVDNARDEDRVLAVGIMESPNKGRRLKLFQETSEESFEESLMAGGYGRYRTADWVRQPQPLSLPAAGHAGSSNVVSRLEDVQQESPTEKELKKRKRLAAFRSQQSRGNTKLCAVELEGKGRVLIDIPHEDHTCPGSPEPSISKKRGAARRKKKGAEGGSVDKKIVGLSVADDSVEKPNWPDTEFPWRLRTEERVEIAKAEEEEKLRWIERFLDRDSDDEDDADIKVHELANDDEEILSRSHWGMVYEPDSERPAPIKMGRGKMVPLSAYSHDSKTFTSKRNLFPSDPADARAALLSKKSVRTLSYRQQKRRRELEHDEDDEVVCICSGKDDGRELVQCDACQTWYHLHCIGIKHIAELGREEDPWFCRSCVARSRSPSPEPEMLITREPTFAPTDNEPRSRRSSDTPFFQPSLQDSPNWHSARAPKTPTRMTYSHPETTHSLSSWVESSRPGPSTPQHYNQVARIYSTPGPLDGYGHHYDESPFDPTSTPSRGIKFTAPFATPKNNIWPTRAHGLFNTPSKPSGRGLPGKTFGGPGTLSAALDDSSLGNHNPVHDNFGRMYPTDESPIRRNKSSGTSSTTRRALHSPSRPRTSGQASFLEDSPVMRSLTFQNRISREVGLTFLDDETR